VGYASLTHLRNPYLIVITSKRSPDAGYKQTLNLPAVEHILQGVAKQR
jgi:hypothetical protein